MLILTVNFHLRKTAVAMPILTVSFHLREEERVPPERGFT